MKKLLYYIKNIYIHSKILFILVSINLIIFIFLFKDIILFDSINDIVYYSFKALIPFLTFLIILIYDYKFKKKIYLLVYLVYF